MISFVATIPSRRTAAARARCPTINTGDVASCLGSSPAGSRHSRLLDERPPLVGDQGFDQHQIARVDDLHSRRHGSWGADHNKRRWRVSGSDGAYYHAYDHPGRTAVQQLPMRGLHSDRLRGAASTAAEELGFRNVSQSPCTLYGYPGDAAKRSERQITQGNRNGDLPSAVGLQPGATAAPLVSGSNGSLPQCAGPHTDSFLVTPPNLTHSVEVTASNSFGSIAI